MTGPPTNGAAPAGGSTGRGSDADGHVAAGTSTPSITYHADTCLRVVAGGDLR